MEKAKFNYDYSKTLWMKMFLAKPDWSKNTSEVLISFEQALEIIKTIDNITQGITKIVYLVGWQGLGHDDCFPEMEVVNPYLKRACDETAKDSYIWLYEEAKKYNTVVSVHGNISDEYAVNQSHGEFVGADAIVKDKDGTPAVIEIFNTRDCYKTSYKQYWESGLFKKYFDRFLEALPIRETGTIHLDNFCVIENLCPETDMYEQDEARNKILDYIAQQGLDVTSEYTYREMPYRADMHNHPAREYFSKNGIKPERLDWKDAPMRTLGRIPASWWLSRATMDECMEIEPSLYSGYLHDKTLRDVFYSSMHGEDIWMNNGIDKAVWVPLFIKEFCTMQLPFTYLNRYRRMSYKGNKLTGYTVSLSEGVESVGKSKSISKNGIELKKGNDLILPLTEDNKIFIAYSEKGKDGEWNIPDAEFEKASVYNITADGNEYIGDVIVTDKKITLSLKPGQAVAVKE